MGSVWIHVRAEFEGLWGGIGDSRHGLYTGNGMSGGLRDGSSSFMNSLVVRPSA